MQKNNEVLKLLWAQCQKWATGLFCVILFIYLLLLKKGVIPTQNNC